MFLLFTLTLRGRFVTVILFFFTPFLALASFTFCLPPGIVPPSGLVGSSNGLYISVVSLPAWEVEALVYKFLSDSHPGFQIHVFPLFVSIAVPTDSPI